MEKKFSGDLLFIIALGLFTIILVTTLLYYDFKDKKEYNKIPKNDAKFLTQKNINNHKFNLDVIEICLRGQTYLMTSDHHGVGLTQILEEKDDRLVPRKCGEEHTVK